MGFAIIGFSLFLRFILNPLTKPYLESIRKIRNLTPELEKLKKKHSQDRVKLAQAQADFYKQKGINPGAGCVPYIIQLIVLVAFFNLFTRTISPNVDIASSFNQFLYKPLKFQEGEKINTSFLYMDITKPDVFSVFNIGQMKLTFPGPILWLATITQFLSSIIMRPYVKKEESVVKKTPQETDDIQVSMQKSMTFIFPLFTLFVGVKVSSGLALYWLVFSLTQFYQQVKAQGWGELASFFRSLGLLKSK